MLRFFGAVLILASVSACSTQQMYDTLANTMVSGARAACNASGGCNVGCGDGYAARKTDGSCARTYR